MSPERYRTVVKRFTGKELFEPFSQTFNPGDQIVFLHHRGDQEELSVFAMLKSVEACTGAEPNPSPQYEAKRDVFDAFTSATQR